MEKLARADTIAEQRHSIAEELQRMRKDIAQQEAWVKARTWRPCTRLTHRIHVPDAWMHGGHLLSAENPSRLISANHYP